MHERICVLTTGGTIDKIYFDALSEFQVGEPQIAIFLREANVAFGFEVRSLLKKDSLDLTDEDRASIAAATNQVSAARVLITHGTDTMIETARWLQGAVKDKVVVLTGAMLPATQRGSDAVFNIGFAIGVLSTQPEGVYIAMNGQIFDPATVRKNRAANRFERT